MLDRLLGRAALKERVAELEAERDSLAEQLEAEERRRSEAARARQEAERRVNRLEDRVAELEDRAERAEAGSGADAAGPALRFSTGLRGGRLAEVVDRLASLDAPPEGAVTAYVTDRGSVPDPVADVLGERVTLLDRVTPCLVCVDDHALTSVALEPVDPPEPFCTRGPGFRLERAWLEPWGRHAVALVRSDLFAVGTYEGAERVAVTGFRTDVQGSHSKGGFSQARFERLREGQIRDHLDRARSVLEETTADVDRLFVVGPSELLGEFADRATATAAVDATGAPEAALEDAVRDLWTVGCHGL